MTTPTPRTLPPEPTNEGIQIGASRVESRAEALYRRVDALEKALFKLQVEIEALRPVRAVSTQEIRRDATMPLTAGYPLTSEGLRGVSVLTAAEPRRGISVGEVRAQEFAIGRVHAGGLGAAEIRHLVAGGKTVDEVRLASGLPVVGHYTLDRSSVGGDGGPDGFIPGYDPAGSKDPI